MCFAARRRRRLHPRVSGTQMITQIQLADVPDDASGDGLDRAQRQHLAQREGHDGGLPHFQHGRGQQQGATAQGSACGESPSSRKVRNSPLADQRGACRHCSVPATIRLASVPAQRACGSRTGHLVADCIHCRSRRCDGILAHRSLAASIRTIERACQAADASGQPHFLSCRLIAGCRPDLPTRKRPANPFHWGSEFAAGFAIQRKG